MTDKTDLEAVMHGPPDYSHLALSKRPLTVTLATDEQAAVLWAFDHGLDALPDDQVQLIADVITELKRVIHP